MSTLTMIAPPLTARSVVLSLLLGTPEASMPVRDLVDAGAMFGIAAPTMRVALSRLVSAGDLAAVDAVYSLSARHLERQRAQDSALTPTTRVWDGSWETVVVIAIGRDASDRARLRAELSTARLAELREGVWMRPANLDRAGPLPGGEDVQVLTTYPDDDQSLVDSLWDLATWSLRGHELLEAIAIGGQSAERLTAAAALVRHLLTDPALPDALTPPQWPADAMRHAYDDYRAELMTLRTHHYSPEENS